MWIIIKLSITLVAFLVRFFAKHLVIKGFYEKRQVGDLNLLIRFIRGAKQTLPMTFIGVPMKCRSIFKLSPETKVDRFCKSLEISTEFQTGDKEFDDKIYIASDDPEFMQRLQGDPIAREIILKLMQKDAVRLSCDGVHLWVKFSGKKNDDVGVQDLCLKLRERLLPLTLNRQSLFKDPFSWKILILESFIWSLAIFAGSEFFEWLVTREDVVLNNRPLVLQGLLAGATVAAIILLAVFTLLKGSSRGHRFILESAFVLLIGLPIGGIGLLNDININLDTSTPLQIEAKIVDLFTRQHRSRRGRTWTSYHMHINPKEEPKEFSVPRQIEISYSKYSSFRVSQNILIEIGRGRLHHPWYKSIEGTGSSKN